MRVTVRLGGLLGNALDASRLGRLSTFITDETSPAMRIFAAQYREQNLEGDWYGEHAGKWLVAAARAAARTGDDALAQRVRRVANFLVDQQQPDGYLGTYAPTHRFMLPQALRQRTWDGAPSVRTWDIWVHSYLVLGLLEVHRHFPDERLLNAARRIGDLCWKTLTDGAIDITALGNHHGLSATVLLDPVTQLYLDTGEQRWLDLAMLVLEQADAHPDLALLRKALAGADAAEIATGKAYQLQWNLVGLAKLHRATGRSDLLRAVELLWASIREHHLTLGGGPWGGVAHRSREVFNAPGFFSPLGFVETCSTLAWIQLNRELLAITGEAKYAEEIERSAYNDLLGAMAPNGQDWCYYVFPNGQRAHTTYWRCCKSSGAMALEELPDIAIGAVWDQGLLSVDVNLHGPAEASIGLPDGATLRLQSHTGYPFDGNIQFRLALQRKLAMRLRIRIPAWAENATALVNDAAAPCQPGHWLDVQREWSDGDAVTLQFPMVPRLQRRSSSSVQESRAPDGTAVRQQVMRRDYAAVTRGPLVYATGLIDGFKIEETIRLQLRPAEDWLQTLPSSTATVDGGPTVSLAPRDRPPLQFVPYYRAGGREHGAWRLTWLALAPQPEA